MSKNGDEKYPWKNARVKPTDGRVVLDLRQYEEIRKKVQLIETIIDGACQQKNPNKPRLSLALSATRSIQTLYFPQLNYSLYYFRGNKKKGEQPLNRSNFKKFKRLKDLEKKKKFSQFKEESEDA